MTHTRPSTNTLRARLKRASIYSACAIVSIAGARSIYTTISTNAPAGVSFIALTWWYIRGPLMIWVASRCAIETHRAAQREHAS